MLREILVPEQNAANLFKLHTGDSPCCGDSAVQCQYTSAAFAAANSVSAIVVKDRDGNNKTLTFPSAVTGQANVLAALKTAIYGQGYEEFNSEVFDGISVNTQSTNLIVVLVGDLEAVSLTHSGGSAAFTAKCTQKSLCDYTITGSAGGATNTLKINGASQALGAITPGTTSASTVKTAVETALSNEGFTLVATVTTTGSGGSTLYNIVISGAPNDMTLVLNGTYLDRSNCAASWV